MWNPVTTLCLLLALAACGELPKAKYEQRSATSIRIADHRFAGATPTVLVREVFCAREEGAMWSASAGEAFIMLAEANPGCIVFEPLETADDLIARFPLFKHDSVRFEDKATAIETQLGQVWGRRFRRNDRECFLFRHSFEAHHVSIESYPTTFIMGYFCAWSGQAMTADDFGKLVASITVGSVPSQTFRRDGLGRGVRIGGG